MTIATAIMHYFSVKNRPCSSPNATNDIAYYNALYYVSYLQTGLYTLTPAFLLHFYVIKIKR